MQQQDQYESQGRSGQAYKAKYFGDWEGWEMLTDKWRGNGWAFFSRCPFWECLGVVTMYRSREPGCQWEGVFRVAQLEEVK